MELVKELGCPVEHIVLPTFAVEHKLFVGPFSRAFPAAQVHVAPRSDSFTPNPFTSQGRFSICHAVLQRAEICPCTFMQFSS